ncbi:hypothetical protein RCIA23 [Methanocella arvoryzae MRE50]|uniref:Uncharacterized protein n=1 Tax=Methanocella arvoryzae (strain DSM 22066 / NBRC 105507 / MRE50) TaxID=351160 RepID=Q0W6L9_METAR|nr:hypothetical protein RCIA23 [Methanocella arvoryzae MRE50]
MDSTAQRSSANRLPERLHSQAFKWRTSEHRNYNYTYPSTLGPAVPSHRKLYIFAPGKLCPVCACITAFSVATKRSFSM